MKYTKQRTETTPKSIGVLLNVPLNVPLSEKIVEMVKTFSGIQRNGLALRLAMTEKTVGRHISKLVSEKKIERHGSKKTGGFRIKFMLPEQVAVDVPKGGGALNEGLKSLFTEINENSGVQAKDLAESLHRPIKTVERQVKVLSDKGLIERRGSKKTGGYWA